MGNDEIVSPNMGEQRRCCSGVPPPLPSDLNIKKVRAIRWLQGQNRDLVTALFEETSELDRECLRTSPIWRRNHEQDR